MALSFSRGFFVFLSLTIGLHADGLDQLIGQFQADRRDLSAARSIPWNATSREREEALIAGWETRLDSLDYDSLDVASRIDWHLLAATLKERRAEFQLNRIQAAQIEPLIAFAKPIQDLLLARSQRQLADPQASAAALDSAIAGAKAIRKKLEESRAKPTPADALQPSPIIALRAAGAIQEILTEQKSWYALYDGFQPDFNWWCQKPNELLAKEMDSLASYLRKEIAGIKGEPEDPLIGDPVGEEAIGTALQLEMIPYSSKELIALAEKEFAWCDAEMKKAATELKCETGLAAVAKIKEQHAPPGGQAAVAIAEAEKAIQFLKSKELVTIPPLAEESWGITMASPEQQKSLPYVAYSAPRMLIAYASEAMSHDEKLMSMRGNNAAFLHIVTPHELIPGHHLQSFMARRHAAYRSAFSTPFFVEGWALYWEMQLWNQGYISTPEEKVGALFWRMHRCARVIISLKFHLGEMTPPQMIDFLVDRVGHERAGATSEVRRYIGGGYGPLYQASYMIGGLQLSALQKELTAPVPGNEGATGKLTLREFHDQILRLGPIPIEMIRASLKKESLPKNWKPVWKFAGSGNPGQR